MTRVVTLAQPLLAYLDSHSGLVPCRITSAAWAPLHQGGPYELTLCGTVTAARGQVLPGRFLYPKGAAVSGSVVSIVPRGAVRFRKYGARILAYSWPALAPELARPADLINP